MLLRILRIVGAFAVGCFAAGMTLVLFVLTPSEIVGLPPDVRADRLAKAMELAGLAAIQIALFAVPFAAVTAALGEMLRTRAWGFYAMSGLMIAAVGFFAQRTTEPIGQPAIANNYSLTAFLAAGFVGGIIYWLLGGRFSGRNVSVTRSLEIGPGSTRSQSEATKKSADGTVGQHKS